MNYLLDTCVISEYTRRKPEQMVIRWMDGIPEDWLFLSVISIGEIQHGIDRLEESHRKNELSVWLNTGLTQRFGQRILSLDMQTMQAWGSLVSRLEKAGTPVSTMDSLIAATAIHNNLIVVTRNESDFYPCGVQIMNPWK